MLRYDCNSLTYARKLLRKSRKNSNAMRSRLSQTLGEQSGPTQRLLFSFYVPRVKEIQPDRVIYTTKGEGGRLVEHEIPCNFVLWSTGIAMNPFTRRVSSLLPNQVHFKAIEVDAHLRVKGAPLGTVYAIGDASVVRDLLCIPLVRTLNSPQKLETNIVSHLLELVDEADRNNDGKIDIDEWKIMGNLVTEYFSHAFAEY